MARRDKTPIVKNTAPPVPVDTTATAAPPDDVTTPVVTAPVATEPVVVAGFTNIQVVGDSVTADFANAYTAPARGDVHITAGPGDTSGDSDQDGISDAAEKLYGTNPHSYDSDGDGIPDGVEVQIGTDPLNKLGDADHDGVPDATELGHGMNPFDADTDHDGIPDNVEYDRAPGLPIVPTPGSTDTDWDGDGIPNDVETMYGRNPTVPESAVPEFQAVVDKDYEARLVLNPDPIQQAMLANDFQKDLTPEQESAVLDAVYERGIEGDVFNRYTLANQLNVLDGTPISPELQAEYDKAVETMNQNTLAALPAMTVAETLGVSRQIAIGGVDASLQDAVDARLTAIVDLANKALATGDPTAMLQLQAALPGTTLTTDILTSISVEVGGEISAGGQISIDGSTPTTATTTGSGSTGSGAVATNPAESALDRMGTLDPFAGSGSGAGTIGADPSTTGDTGGDTGGDVGGVAAPVDEVASPSPSTPVEFVPDNTASQAADNLGSWADSVAGSLGGDGSGSNQAPPPASIDMDAMLSGEVGGVGTTTTGTTDDGRSYTQTDLGDAGFQRTYDDTGTIQFFDSDGTAKGGELDPHADAGSDGTNPYVDTTDDDGTAPEDSDDPDAPDDDGTLDEGSGTGVAYVNPDADVITVGLAPVTAQMIVTGSDPTTTTPSNPYVDDAVAPIVVSNHAVAVGFDVPMDPGVTDGGGVEDVTGGVPLAFDPAGPDAIGGVIGPDVINPDDPVLGGGGEDINVGDFTPRPSAALTGLMGEGPGDDGFDLP